jgi:acyl-CoA synthetase (AMP-forming)/AMP-acid ligase II
MNLFLTLAQSARRYPDRGAVFVGEKPFVSFAMLHERALRLAGALANYGGPGDRVVIASRNCREYIEIMFAVWAAGMVVVPINAKLHALEMAGIVEDSEPVLILSSAQIAAALTQELDSKAPVMVIGEAAYHELLEHPAALPHEASPEDLAWLFFTSGTTGRPKGAMLSHRNLMATAVAHLADLDCAQAAGTLLHAAPLSHGSGLYVIPYMMRGVRQVIPPSGVFDPAEFLSLCNVHPGVRAFLAPTMVRRVREEAERNRIRPANLQLILYGGGPMYLDELKRARQVFGPVLAQLYGQGESPMTITALRRTEHETHDDTILGSVGWPRSGVEVAVVGPDGRTLPAGQIGEITCRGDVVMKGYWRSPAATAEALKAGWLYTGDLGTLATDGKLTLQGRSKDLIISGGTNMWP